MSETRKPILAVNAHIRHCHTDYEMLLRDAGYVPQQDCADKGLDSRQACRNHVAQRVRDVAAAWRGPATRKTEWTEDTIFDHMALVKVSMFADSRLQDYFGS